MTYTIIEGTPTPQSQDNGEPWPLVLLLDEKSTMYTDSYTDILGVLVDGYEEIPDDEEGDTQALLMRVEHAVVVASTIQAMMLHDAVAEGVVDIGEADEDFLSTLLTDRTQPIRIDSWDHDVSLVLLTIDYAPFNVLHAPPSGNIVWLDPSDEADYVRSLNSAGAITLLVQQD